MFKKIFVFIFLLLLLSVKPTFAEEIPTNPPQIPTTTTTTTTDDTIQSQQLDELKKLNTELTTKTDKLVEGNYWLVTLNGAFLGIMLIALFFIGMGSKS